MHKEIIGDCTLILGDCLEVLPTLGRFDVLLADPPYEAQAHTPMRRTRATIEGRTAAAGLGFDSITERERTVLAKWCSEHVDRWALFFCQVEAVALWKDSFERTGAKYDRAWAWIKPDAAPRFNGQGPAQGYESIVSAWCGKNKRAWNGGGSRNVLTYNVTSGRQSDHPTEKPVVLIERLLSLYSDKGQDVIDSHMGSGTTGVACVNLNRKFTGIELELKYFDIACHRIEQAYKNRPRLFDTIKEKPKQSALF